MLEIGWIAGLMEGEGCFRARRKVDLVVQINMTDRDTIDRLHRVLGFGTTKVPRELPSGKFCYGWSVTNQHQAAGLMMTLLPLMGERRSARIRECLAAWKTKPLRKSMWTHCKHGHPLSGDNLYIAHEGKYTKRRCKLCGLHRQKRYHKAEQIRNIVRARMAKR